MPASQTDYRSTHSRPSGRVWEIRGYDGEKEVLSYEVPGDVSEQEVRKILKRLTSHDLTLEEIVDHSIRHDRGFLRVSQDVKKGHLRTEGNPHYVARLRESSD